MQILALAGAVEEHRLVADARHDDRLAAFGYPPGDAFPQAITRLLAPRCQAMRRGDGQFRRLALEQGNDARKHGVVTFEQFQHPVQGGFQVQGAGQSLTHRHKRGELRFFGNGCWHVGGFLDSVPPGTDRERTAGAG